MSRALLPLSYGASGASLAFSLMGEPPLLLAVPNVSEGRDRAVHSRRSSAASAPARFLDLHTDPDHGRVCVHARCAAGAARRGPAWRRTGGNRADRSHSPRRHPPSRWRPRRDAGRLPGRGTPRRRLRRGSHRRRARGRGPAHARLPVRRAGQRPEQRERAWIRRGGPPELARTNRGGRARPGLRAGKDPSDRGRRPRGGAAAARGLQRRSRHRRPRDGAGDRRRAPRVGRGTAGRAGARSLPRGPWPGAGVDERA